MDMTTQSCRAFVDALASSAPAPGGGGAAALVGAIGTALGNMVAELTLGKPKYAAVEEQILALRTRCDGLRQELIDQVEADERGFLPLAKAYGIPKDDPRRQELLEKATLTACAAPMKIMELCADAIECLKELAAIGSRLAVSDAGCGAVLCKAAMQAASLNIFINTKTMTDRPAAEALNCQTQELLDRYGAKADAIFAHVQKDLNPS